MAVKVSKIGKSAVRISLNEGSIIGGKGEQIRGNTEMFSEEDCIDIPEYKKADGTVVEAHTRCIDRVFTTDETHPEDVKRLAKESDVRSRIIDMIGQPDFDYAKDSFKLIRELAEGGGSKEYNYEFSLESAMSDIPESSTIKGLDDIENAFIKAYTDYEAHQVNLGLREPDELDIVDKAYAMGLQSVLAKAPKIGKTVLYRDVLDLEFVTGDYSKINEAIVLYENNIGGVVNFDAFTSTSRSTRNFTASPSTSLKYVIQTSEDSRGVDVSGLSKHDDESEVLFPMDSKFEITKVERDYKGYTAAVYLKEI